MSLETNAVENDEEEFVDELKPGTKLMLGQYTIEDFLAAGGFGITYLAKDSLDRRVVIKECFPGSFCRRQNHSVTPRSRAHQNELKSIVRLFSQEAMSLAKANHPNIVGVHQVFEENNTAYMALDYVHGRDLLEILEEDPDSLKPDLVEGYLVKILDAVKHIHKMDILHRDISPDNIIINDQGEPILIDFGAARESSNERVTRMLSALRVVKDGYSPQEFYIAGSDQGPSCDLYSLAASFYHLITRELPPDSQLRLSSCAAGDEDPYVSLGEKTGDYSKSFISALDKAMSILPRDRMQDADEWLEHLENGAPVDAPKPATNFAPKTAANEDKKPFMPILLGTTAIAAAAGAGLFFMSGSGDENPQSIVGGEQVATVVETPEVTAPAVEEAPVATDTETAAATERAEESVPTFQQPTPAEPETATASVEPEAVPAEETAAVEDTAAVPDLPEVAEVTIEIAEPPIPAVEETTDFVVPPIVLARSEAVVKPQPRPFREAEVAVAEFEDTVPEVDTVTPEAPVQAPLIQVLEPEAPVVEEPEAPVVATVEPEAPAAAVPKAPVAEVTEPETPAPEATVEVAENTTSDPAQSIGSADSLNFFMAMGSSSQPDIVSASNRRQNASDTTEAAEAAQPTQPAAVENSAPVDTATTTDGAPTLSSDVSGIVTRFVSDMPFTLSPWQPGVVISIAENGPAWLEANSRIVSVNGQAVATNEDISAAFDAAVPQDASDTFEVMVGFDTGLNTAVTERSMNVPTEQHIMLLNGLQFVAREAGNSWITEVSQAPASSNFKIGDRLVSFVSTWEDLTGPDSLETILNRELAAGTSTFSFAVSRNGEIWIEAFNLASLN
ncbi:MAG: protein kinase [Pseudomonadota bacterium]